MTAAPTRSVIAVRPRASGNERLSRRTRHALSQDPLVRQMLSYERRLKAAGLPPDDAQHPINEFGRMRRRAMWINHWHGCPLPLCRRHRGCMAPDLTCANAA